MITQFDLMIVLKILYNTFDFEKMAFHNTKLTLPKICPS